ncbi:putative NOL1/NOP2/sun domain protein [Microthyrium microscopicum]|uniref:Putative NOL1/NOP2/sun domain protein n=1 Tax=Microthyrium microscopicum TaxID=703497 RepID=A0A6A6UN00_9PEZI|nr:putative NOL1/NOP2/sun domain protein [Microthyrium microscopicum]
MSLYYDAVAVISNEERVGGSLKSRIYANKSSKHAPAQIYALVSETTKWSAVLKEVIEKAGILKIEKKLTDVLALLLVHDLILSKRGIAAPQSHALCIAVNRHRSRLNAEFTKLRIRKGYPTLQAFRQSIDASSSASSYDQENEIYPHPRWVRINTLKTSWDKQLKSTFADFEETNVLENVLKASKNQRIFHVDANVENLIALPPLYDTSKMDAYRKSLLILQDKASCFPATLLDPMAHDGDMIDACAAPGNKTTHLAALSSSKDMPSGQKHIFAFERDTKRAETLRKMVAQAGANELVTILGSTDFLQVVPTDDQYSRTTGILLDPSCSGSGIVGRDEEPAFHVPTIPAQSAIQPGHKSKKRKRSRQVEKQRAAESPPVQEESIEEADDETEKRLEALASFQLKLLLHGMKFPDARRIVYSTCSIHVQENEGVVIQALMSEAARSNGWTILPRMQQPPGLQAWSIRGLRSECEQLMASLPHAAGLPSAKEVAEACIRCEKGTAEGTMGFFVCGFSRDPQSVTSTALDTGLNENIDEWDGFSDSE